MRQASASSYGPITGGGSADGDADIRLDPLVAPPVDGDLVLGPLTSLTSIVSGSAWATSVDVDQETVWDTASAPDRLTEMDVGLGRGPPRVTTHLMAPAPRSNVVGPGSAQVRDVRPRTRPSGAPVLTQMAPLPLAAGRPLQE